MNEIVNKKGKRLPGGKTKEMWRVVRNKGLVIIKSKNDITALDDPKRTKTFPTKARLSNTTTCLMFELLKQANIPVAYKQQLSSKEFLAINCRMIKIEAVARRYAAGSYLKRHIELIQPEGKLPYRFSKLVTEFFLKTTKGDAACISLFVCSSTNF